MVPGNLRATLGTDDHLEHNGHQIAKGVVLVHRSALFSILGARRWKAWALRIAKQESGPTFVVVSGGRQLNTGECPQLYFRRTAVLEIEIDPFFGACFREFHLQASQGTINFALLEPKAIGDELAAAFVTAASARYAESDLPDGHFWAAAKAQFRLHIGSSHGAIADLSSGDWPAALQSSDARGIFIVSVEGILADLGLA
jgi:hypothetical protein